MPTVPQTSAKVNLRYAQVEELVGWLLDLHAERKPALTARLKLFRQRGFPPNVNSGSKARFTYDLDAAIRITLAFQLIDGLVPQEAVPAFIERHWVEIRTAFYRAFAMIEEKGGEDAAAEPTRPILILRPRSLLAFSRARSEEVDQASTFPGSISTAEEFEHYWRSPDGEELFGPIIAIDLQQLAGWLRDALLSARWAEPESFRQPQQAERDR